MLTTRRLIAALAAGGLLLAGCARFDDSAADANFHDAPELTPQQGPQPELPEAQGGEPPGPGGPGGGGPGGGGGPVKPPDGCTDFDEAVIGTCLDTVVAVAAMPTSAQPAALAAEQRSGKVFKVVKGKKPVTWAKLPVNAGGDGGLTGIALSPTYPEDSLVFAYITTASDNRVVRFQKGEKPKAVLTGIPKGSSGNRGALATDLSGALLVATGDAGDRKKAADPQSLAGKVLRIDTSGKPAQGNPKSGSRVLASGVHSPGGVCASADGTRIWVTDRAAEADAIHEVRRGKPLGTPTWTWKDKPGVAGCADSPEGVSVAMSSAGGMQGLEIDAQGSVTGKPHERFTEKDSGYGRLAGMDVLTQDIAVVGTVNRDGGKPVSSDDRVVLLPLQPTGGAGKD